MQPLLFRILICQRMGSGVYVSEGCRKYTMHGYWQLWWWDMPWEQKWNHIPVERVVAFMRVGMQWVEKGDDIGAHSAAHISQNQTFRTDPCLFAQTRKKVCLAELSYTEMKFAKWKARLNWDLTFGEFLLWYLFSNGTVLNFNTSSPLKNKYLLERHNVLGKVSLTLALG